MASEVSVCSNALLMLGAKPISSLVPGGEGNADRVQLAANLWPLVRDDLLRAHPWNCAVKRRVLSPDATAPAFDYSARFLLPEDWLRTLQVGEDGNPIDYRAEGRYLLAEGNALPLVYVSRNEDVSSWDTALISVATARMAAAMAYAVTQSASLAEAMERKAEMAFKRATAEDGQDEPPYTLGDYRQTASRF